MAKKKRMAGDAVKDLYGGEDEYGKWGSTWDSKAEQQQLKASGKYDAESDLAKQFGGMKENISSRVDDEDGWRQLDIDGDLKDPAKYAKLVNKWSGAGFDVRAIDMGKGFHSSNIAVRMSDGKGTGVKDPVTSPGDGGGDDGGSGSKPVTSENTSNQEITVSGPIKPGGFGSQYQNINQDNDITTNITGNQNVVTNTQDNSIGQSGGNFTYAEDYARGLKDRYILNLTNR